MAKKPPPPSSDTVRLKGCSRVEKLKRTETGLRVERQVEAGAERRVRQREDADADRRQRQRVAGADAARRHREPRRIGEPVGRE